MEEVFAKPEEIHRQRVLYNTWGYLYPEVRKAYRGHLLIAKGDYDHATTSSSRPGSAA
jgi:hypothetical protein